MRSAGISKQTLIPASRIAGFSAEDVLTGWRSGSAKMLKNTSPGCKHPPSENRGTDAHSDSDQPDVGRGDSGQKGWISDGFAEIEKRIELEKALELRRHNL
jgi:hypothetical protein